MNWMRSRKRRSNFQRSEMNGAIDNFFMMTSGFGNRSTKISWVIIHVFSQDPFLNLSNWATMRIIMACQMQIDPFGTTLVNLKIFLLVGYCSLIATPSAFFICILTLPLQRASFALSLGYCLFWREKNLTIHLSTQEMWNCGDSDNSNSLLLFWLQF